MLTFFRNTSQGKSTPHSPLPPNVQQDLKQKITAWLSLSDKQAWQKMGDLVKTDNLSKPQQVLLLNFLQPTRHASTTWQWTASAKRALVKQMAGEFNDYDMYYVMANYLYEGKALPFNIGAECVRLALAR